MASGVLGYERRFIEVGQGFQDVLLASLVLMWRVLGTALGVAFASLGFTWLVSHPTWGDVDGPACHLHRPTAYG
jgi:hypothetical protein